MPFLIKVTTTETYSIDFELVNHYGPIVGFPGVDEMTVEDALVLGGGDFCRQAEKATIALFELHEGSQFGDKMFSWRRDPDSGIELIWEND